MRVNQHVVFVGLMASGKTTVGRIVADRLGRPLRDSDEHIESTTGMTASDYAAAHGIDALHEREAEALLVAMEEPNRTVVAAAASTIEVAPCRVALADGFVVWLRTDPAVAAPRAVADDHRPLAPDPEAQLRAQAEARYDLFAAVADLVLDVGDHQPDELADRVMSQFAH